MPFQSRQIPLPRIHIRPSWPSTLGVSIGSGAAKPRDQVHDEHEHTGHEEDDASRSHERLFVHRAPPENSTISSAAPLQRKLAYQGRRASRSEEHTSELQSHSFIS